MLPNKPVVAMTLPTVSDNSLDYKVVRSMLDPTVWKVIEGSGINGRFRYLETNSQGRRVVYCPHLNGMRAIYIPELGLSKKLKFLHAVVAYQLFLMRERRFHEDSRRKESEVVDFYLSNIGV